LAIAIISQFAAAQNSGGRVHDHVARAGVEGHYLVEARARREEGEVANAADVLQNSRAHGIGLHRPVHVGHERSALPARRHVAHAKISNGQNAGALGDHRRFTDLQS
jgi:hypothetical protein